MDVDGQSCTYNLTIGDFIVEITLAMLELRAGHSRLMASNNSVP